MTLEGRQHPKGLRRSGSSLFNVKGVFSQMEMESAVLDKESPIPTIDGDISVDRSITSPLAAFGPNDGRIQVRYVRKTIYSMLLRLVEKRTKVQRIVKVVHCQRRKWLSPIATVAGKLILEYTKNYITCMQRTCAEPKSNIQVFAFWTVGLRFGIEGFFFTLLKVML